jgi:multidrug resistance efflux pump
MNEAHIKSHGEEADRIQLRSEEVQEIMGYVPAWIIRWGITVLLLAVIAALTLSWFVKYPDILPAQVILTSDPPPLRLVAPISAKVEHIFVEEDQKVQEGAWLMAFESPAAWRDVQQLESLLEQQGDILSLLPLPDLDLGSLQSNYSGFRKALEDWQFFAESRGYRSSTRSSTARQAAELRALNANIAEQLKLKKRELALAENEYRINQNLFEQGSVSRVELERSEVETIQKNLAIKQLEAQIHNNDIQLMTYRQKMGDFGQKVQEDELRFQVAAQEGRRQLGSAIESWKKQYLLIAPQAGNVAFLELWAVSQQVEQGNAVISILPPSRRIIGKATLPQRGAGKLRVGQRTNIKLDNYDYKQFGMLSGKVVHISPIAQKDQYLVDLKLDKGLVTTYGQELDFQAELYGQAEIITDELRLLERVFFEFRRLFEAE